MSGLDEQKEKNVQLMQILQENGVHVGEMRIIDFFYYTKDKGAAHSLQDDLESRFGYQARVEKQGWFRPTYSICGTARVNATVDELNAFCEKMWTCGLPHGIEFDGWGAEV